MGRFTSDAAGQRSLYEHLRASAPGGAGEADDAHLARFLKRVGLAAGRCNIPQAIDRLAAAAGDEPGRVREVLAAYCRSGSFCMEPPNCPACPVAARCRHFGRKPGIKDLPAEERPRERLITGGEEQLSNAELVGIIIRDGTPDATAVDLAASLLSRYGDLRTLASKTVAELCQMKGIGPAKAAQIKAALTLGRRMQRELAAPAGAQFNCGKAVYDYCLPAMDGLKKEVFKVLLLDAKNRLIREVQISEGTLTSSMVHPREAFNPAIRESANAVIFVHNHPSGDPTPSKDDVAITRQMKQAADVLNIKVLDHVVIGRGGFFSFADEGYLK
jgi:DNA repair protein RadC